MSGFFDTKAQLTETGRKPPPAAPELLSVSELTAQIKQTLKGAFARSIAVKGEVSNFRGANQAGHLYFSIKDAGAILSVVMFATSTRGLKFELQDGLEVIATGRLDVYEPGGRYNLVASTVVPVGTGALELAYRQLYERLAGEGLFAPERKRPIPAYPRTLALVTSRSAAALQDMLKVLRRFPFLRVIVVPVPVQGEGAAEKIAKALVGINQYAAALGGVDLILLGRGGGSFEDLFEFSRESVARAVAASEIPIITGIGHEVDTAIADLVADHHAHTPTEAASFAVRFWATAETFVTSAESRLRLRMEQRLRDGWEWLARVERAGVFARPEELTSRRHQRVDDLENRLHLHMGRRLARERQRLGGMEGRLTLRDPRRVLRARQQGLEEAAARLERAMVRRCRAFEASLTSAAARLQRRGPRELLERLRARLAAAEGQLRVLGPESVLARGYSITRRTDGTVIRRADEVSTGEELVTRLGEGEVRSRVQ